MKRKINLLFISTLLLTFMISGCSSKGSNNNNIEPTKNTSDTTSSETPSTDTITNESKDDYQYVDVSSITSEAPNEIETIINQINETYSLNLQFITDSSRGNDLIYVYQDEAAQDKQNIGNAIAFFIDSQNGRYSKVEIESEEVEILLDVSNLIAKKIGYTTYDIDELTQIFNDSSKSGDITEFIGANGYGYSYEKATKFNRPAIDFKILE